MIKQTKRSKRYIWACDYCKKEFKTKGKSDTHEKRCVYNPDIRKKIGWFLFSFICLLVIVISFNFINQTIENNSIPQSNNKPLLVVPTVDPDPYINCAWEEVNGKANCQEKKMRQSECSESVCCGLGNGTYAPMDKIECARFQAEINSKKPARAPIKIEVPKIEPRGVTCNYDLIGNWVCRESW